MSKIWDSKAPNQVALKQLNICNLPVLLSQTPTGLHNIILNISLNTSLKTVFTSRINSTICFYFCNLIWHGYPTARNKRIQCTSWSMRNTTQLLAVQLPTVLILTHMRLSTHAVTAPNSNLTTAPTRQHCLKCQF